jgi:hypothetical protein
VNSDFRVWQGLTRNTARHLGPTRAARRGRPRRPRGRRLRGLGEPALPQVGDPGTFPREPRRGLARGARALRAALPSPRLPRQGSDEAATRTSQRARWGLRGQRPPSRPARARAAGDRGAVGDGRVVTQKLSAGPAPQPDLPWLRRGHSGRCGTQPVLPGGGSARPSICARSSSRKRAQSARRSSETNSPGGSGSGPCALSGCCLGSRNHSPLPVETVGNSCVRTAGAARLGLKRRRRDATLRRRGRPANPPNVRADQTLRGAEVSQESLEALLVWPG